MGDDKIYDELKKEWLSRIAEEDVPHKLTKLAKQLDKEVVAAPIIEAKDSRDDQPAN
ncbi:hypothetical protein GTW25_07485 [Aliihoeflea aestuarii]|uniref:hypothetical protein n=1 Tax=Aliihoeflea aestuarii TaxID=453840 RepID=UPI002093873A|nr:hypothetical protein [Aliihoeflea aestuarii]MCO6390869.1 hypothetical protein [Aliihoeflea aestuarii]